jgi:hypothetical protein
VSQILTGAIAVTPAKTELPVLELRVPELWYSKVAEVDVAEVPPGVMTEISTVEVLVLAGDRTVMEVGEVTVKLLAISFPKNT